jgi:hypothetical protein
MAQQQVKSKERVASHGEVFTAPREVNAMLDLVKQETERIDSRFLEPACGDGNFLAEILRRKLAAVRARYRKSPADFEKYAVVALTSIYGVDILQDNVEACRARLFDIWDEAYTAHCRNECREACRDAARYILSRNILCGNALTMRRVDGEGRDTDEPIVFSEWNMVTGSLIKRRDYRLDALMGEVNSPRADGGQLSMFDPAGSAADSLQLDPETKAWIPKPLREYPLTAYWRVQEGKNESIG